MLNDNLYIGFLETLNTLNELTFWEPVAGSWGIQTLQGMGRLS